MPYQYIQSGIKSNKNVFLLFALILRIVWTTEECTGAGIDYRGSISQTRRKRTCLPWSTFYKVTYPEKGLGDHNYCRNPTEQAMGPYCIVSYNGPGISEDIDYCDVTCKPGLLTIYYDHVCKFNKMTLDEVRETQNSRVLTQKGSLKSCMKACIDRTDCTHLAFKSEYTYCLMCELDRMKRPVAERENGWRVMMVYDEKTINKCRVSSEHRRNQRIDTSQCDTSEHTLNKFSCVVNCAKMYSGSVEVECHDHGAYFSLTIRCERGCYISEKIAILKNIDRSQCKSSPTELRVKSECHLYCDFGDPRIPSKDVDIECYNPGQLFSLLSKCEFPKCYLSNTTRALPGYNFDECDATPQRRLSTEECTVKCLPEFIGYVSAICISDEIFLDGNCQGIGRRLEIPKTDTENDDKNVTELDFTNPETFRDLITEEAIELRDNLTAMLFYSLESKKMQIIFGIKEEQLSEVKMAINNALVKAEKAVMELVNEDVELQEMEWVEDRLDEVAVGLHEDIYEILTSALMLKLISNICNERGQAPSEFMEIIGNSVDTAMSKLEQMAKRSCNAKRERQGRKNIENRREHRQREANVKRAESPYYLNERKAGGTFGKFKAEYDDEYESEYHFMGESGKKDDEVDYEESYDENNVVSSFGLNREKVERIIDSAGVEDDEENDENRQLFDEDTSAEESKLEPGTKQNKNN